MPFKFENLEVWQLALDYVDLMYQLADQLSRQEEFNLKSQLLREATSIVLNIAEGSTGQTDAKQARVLGHALRSLLETVACQHLVHRRGYSVDTAFLRTAYRQAETLARKLQVMRKAIAPGQPWLREQPAEYVVNEESPF